MRADNARAGHRSELATSAHVGAAISIEMQITANASRFDHQVHLRVDDLHGEVDGAADEEAHWLRRLAIQNQLGERLRYDCGDAMSSIDRWNVERDGPMTEENIRRLHESPPPHRISRYKYDPGDSYEGLSRPTTMYVTEGGLFFQYDEGAVTLTQGDVVSFDGRRHFVRNDGAVPAVVFWVWVIPTEIMA